MRDLVTLNPVQTSALAYKAIHSVMANTSNAEIYTSAYSCELEANEEGYTLALRHLIRDMQAQRYTAKFYSNLETASASEVISDAELPMPMGELLQLINKKLSQDGIKICKSISARMEALRGRYYAENLKGFLIAKDINPISWARELGIL